MFELIFYLRSNILFNFFDNSVSECFNSIASVQLLFQTVPLCNVVSQK